jgi:hypothetical protein
VIGVGCTVSSSSVTSSTVNNSTVQGGSTVTGSTIQDGSVVTGSTITNSTLINATVNNSTVQNSTLIDVIVDDATIIDGVIYNGTIHDSFFYNATQNGSANLSDIINYPPVAVISASATSGTDSLAVTFDASGSTDPNIPGLLNDSLTYSWDWDASDGISSEATGVNASHTFGVGDFVVTLTVTDSFGKSSSATVAISVSSSGSSGGSTSSGGGGGGGGGRTGQTFILVLTQSSPSKSLFLKSSDTVKYRHDGKDYSFLFRYVYSDKAKMGVSTSKSYKEYTLDENKKYNLDLDGVSGSDISILPSNLHLGSGNFTFSLTNVTATKKPFVLPFTSVKKKTVTPSTANESASLASEPAETEAKTEEAFSQGVLEFIESLTMKKSAPLWAGLLVSLLIILAGLGLYYLVTRKED